jgi:hypothetical protein
MNYRLNRTRQARDAWRLVNAGDWSGALRYCTKHLKKPNADPDLYVIRGVMYFTEDKLRRGLKDFEAATQTDDREVVARGYQYLGEHRFGWAPPEPGLEFFWKAIELGFVDGYYGLAYLTYMCRERLVNKPGPTELIEVLLGYLDRAMTSPCLMTQARTLSLRSAVLCILVEDIEQGTLVKKESERLFELHAQWMYEEQQRLDKLDGLIP